VAGVEFVQAPIGRRGIGTLYATQSWQAVVPAWAMAGGVGARSSAPSPASTLLCAPHA
jgi:hypothetical protein